MKNATSQSFYRRTPNTHEIKKETSKMYAQPSKEYQQLLEKTLSEELLKTLQSKMGEIENRIENQIQTQLKPQIAQEARKQVSKAIQSTTLEVQINASKSLETRLTGLDEKLDSLANQQTTIIQTLDSWTSTFSRLETTLTDLNTTLTVLAAPPTSSSSGGTLNSLMTLLTTLKNSLQALPTRQQLQDFGSELSKAQRNLIEVLTADPR